MTRIYLDHAAHTPALPEIIYGMAEHMGFSAGNPSSLHEEGRTDREALENARAQVARLCGTDPRHVIFTSGGTEADNLALLGLCRGLPVHKRRILISSIEHDAMRAQIPALRELGCEVVDLKPDANGIVRPETVESHLDTHTGVVAVQLANHETGTVQPIPEIAEIAHRYGAYLVCDAVAGAPYLDLRTDAAGADVLTLSGHKIGGPDGIGAVAGRADLPIQALWYGGAQERGRRPGTEPLTGAVGLGLAADILDSSRENRALRAETLKTVLLRELSGIPGLTFHAQGVRTLPSHLSLSADGVPGKILVALADRRGVALSTGAACRSSGDELSPVLLSMGLSEDLCRTAVRLSLCYTQSEEEMHEAAARIRDAILTFRGQ